MVVVTNIRKTGRVTIKREKNQMATNDSDSDVLRVMGLGAIAATLDDPIWEGHISENSPSQRDIHLPTCSDKSGTLENHR